MKPAQSPEWRGAQLSAAKDSRVLGLDGDDLHIPVMAL